MHLTWPSNSSIGIVGAGASGTLVAIRLLDEANRRQRRLDVHLVDPRRAAGNGVAYSTRDSRHLLNVQARGMSAYADDPHHFLRWLERDTGCEIDPCSFVPRMFYGRYLDQTPADAAPPAPWARLHRRHERVVAADPSRTRCTLSLADGEQLVVDAAVLALGCVGSATAWAPESLIRSPRFVAEPWTDGALASVDDDLDVLVVGAGLTMVDVFRTLDRPGRVVHAISRRGRMPARHRPGIPPRMEAPELPAEPTLEDLRTALQRHLAKARDRYGDWRPAVDSIRSMTPKLWAGLSTQDREAFLAHDARVGETLRHRIPPRTSAAVDAARSAGRLTTRHGTVVAARQTAGGIAVTLSDGTTLQVGAVVNCT